MKNIIFTAIILLGMLSACQDDDYTLDETYNNGLLSMKFEGQLGESVITVVPVLETQLQNTVSLALKAGTDYSNVKLNALEISKGASASIKVGDMIDLSKEQSFTITSANGSIREFAIIPPEKFDVAKQGEQLTLNINGQNMTMSIGEWLCFGQNRTWDIDAKGNKVGFYRAGSGSATAPVVDNNGKVTYLSGGTAYGDDDDYLIFNSNGMYEFSYGKDGMSSTLENSSKAGSSDYTQYLVKQSRGYWTIVPGRFKDEEKPEGVLLVDEKTGETFKFDYINFKTKVENIPFFCYPNSAKYDPRVRYQYVVADADTDANPNTMFDWASWVKDLNNTIFTLP